MTKMHLPGKCLLVMALLLKFFFLLLPIPLTSYSAYSTDKFFMSRLMNFYTFSANLLPSLVIPYVDNPRHGRIFWFSFVVLLNQGIFPLSYQFKIQLGWQYGTRLEFHGAVTKWYTRRGWPVNCLTVISVRL